MGNKQEMEQLLISAVDTMSITIGELEKWENNVLTFKLREEYVNGEALLHEMIASILLIQNGDKSPIIMDFRGLKEIEMQNRILLFSALGGFATHAAIIIDDNPVLRYSLNVCNQLRIKSCPVKFFNDFDSADNWLDSHKKNA